MSECKHEFSTAAVYDRVCEFCYRLELKIENEALKQRVSELQRDYQMLEAIQAGDGVIINTYKNQVSELEKENTRWAKVADAQAAEIAALVKTLCSSLVIKRPVPIWSTPGVLTFLCRIM
jgi:hypothetical protein